MYQEMDGKLSPAQVFSKIGFALFIMSVVTILTQAILISILEIFKAQGIITSSWVLWLGSFLPLYLIGVPVGLFLLRQLPARPVSHDRLGIGKVLLLLLFCFPAMYLGNFIGVWLSQLLSSGQATNSLDTFVYDSNPIRIVVLVILAPIIEEYVFRKILLDRIVPYGEKTAIVFSGIVFSLFHMNLFQVPYTFLLGAIFAYLYLRTGRLFYPIVFHVIINFLGSVVAPFLVSVVDMELLNQILYGADAAALEALATMDWGTAMYILYTIALPILSGFGILLFMMKRKKIAFQPTLYELPPQGCIRIVYGNMGMILYIIFCLAIVVIGLMPETS